MKNLLRILVVGSSGFIGSHLLRYLSTRDEYNIFAIDKDVTEKKNSENIIQVGCDLLESKKLTELVEELAPHAVIHLAGLTISPVPADFFKAHVLSTANLCNTLSKLPIKPFAINVGSAAQYGKIDCETIEATEDLPLKPLTAYGLSKSMQEEWFMGYVNRGAFPGCSIRIFNTIGLGQNPDLLPASFIKQVYEVKTGKREYMTVGDLDTARDFIDMRDIVMVFPFLIDAGDKVNGHAFNIATGSSVSIDSLLDACLEMGGYDRSIVRINQELLKKKGSKRIVGNIDKIKSFTGWSPCIPWKKAIQYIWDNYAI